MLEHTLTNAVGTLRYMAPEVIRGVFVGGLILAAVAYIKSITGQKTPNICIQKGNWKVFEVILLITIV